MMKTSEARSQFVCLFAGGKLNIRGTVELRIGRVNLAR
jgi:hypothetical protein